MTTSPASPLLSPEEIAVRAGQQIPFLRLPERKTVFSAREMRLRALAAGHPMRDFLLFAAELAQAQHRLLQDYPDVPLPDVAALHAAAQAGATPLPAATWPRAPQWRAQWRRMLDDLLPRLQGNPAQAAAARLRRIDERAVELQADRLLNNVMFGLDMAAAPVIAAGLQVYWTHMATALQEQMPDEAPFGRTVDATRCPCCGSLPTASLLRVDGNGNYRYLHCSLCAAQWHMVRIKCTHCESTKGIHYHAAQPAAGDGTQDGRHVIQAETCDECGHYLKIMRMDRDIAVEPAADDLATLTLDLLVSEAGYRRHGTNLMLLFGDPDGHDDGSGGGR